jgi:hypothetical protein
MTIDEYADLEAAHGEALVKVDGIWWKRVRPFFYQPLYPFLEIAPRAKKPPPGSRIGGYRHLVPPEAPSNCRRAFLVWDAVHEYSIDGVGHQTRSNIKKGMKHFAVRPIHDVEEFISSGHAVYLSFYARTKYPYKNERVDKNYFGTWARTLYRFPQVKIMGAYYQGELSAVDISYLVEDVLFAATFFAKTEHLKYQVADLMTHEMQQKAAASPGITLIFKGTITGNAGLDGSKLRRGCGILSKPAFFLLNPLADVLLRRFMHDTYKKITGAVDATASDRQ